MTEWVGVSKKESVLVVDDVPANVTLLSRILNAQGYAVHTAHDGVTALELVPSTQPDLVLLDIQMPQMDGYEVCQRLKADERTRKIPVIFISAINDTDGIVRALNIGGVDYITKPFKIKEVLARVQGQLLLVAQRKEIEALREQDRLHFDSLDKMKTRFIQMATHDLKNPLAVILGYSELLEELEVSEQEQAFLNQSLNGIQVSVAKMQRLIADMLDLAKLETGVDLVLAPLDLTPFLEKCLRNFEQPARQKQIALSLRPPAREITLVLDEHRMERAMDNLISNAIKYTPDGGTVELAAWSTPDHVEIQVSDTGLGIPAEALPHLFEVFYRVKTSEHLQIEGTGLGLTVVKTIIEQQGGQILAASEPGQGSTFTIRLPLTR